VAERGSVLPVLAVLLVAAAAAVALAADMGRFAATVREATFAAEAGAEAGAAVIDPAAAYRDRLRLDPGPAREAARQAALRARPRPDRSVSVFADDASVCVTVWDRFRPGLLRIFGVGSRTVQVHSCAVPVRG
jgi:hypothetical protein